MKKAISVFLMLCMVVGFSAASAETDAGMTAGTYEATATGYNGPVTVAVTVSDRAIGFRSSAILKRRRSEDTRWMLFPSAW